MSRKRLLASSHRVYDAYSEPATENLGVEDESLGGVFAWFSLIHTNPSDIDTALAEFARCLRLGGSLLIGFFSGAAREPFDHAVATAFYWSVAALSECLRRAGLTVVDSSTRADPNARSQGLVCARK